MSQNAIELRGLKKTYAATKKTEAKTALSGIDLDIPRGAIQQIRIFKKAATTPKQQ